MKTTKSQALLKVSVCTGLVALAFVLLPVDSASAQDWRFEPIIRVGGEFDDNATLRVRTDEEVELAGYLLDLLADINYRSPKSTFFIQPRFLWRKYPDEPDFDSDDVFLKSSYRYTGAVNTLGFRANYDHQSVRTAERTDAEIDIDDPGFAPDNDSGRTLRTGTRDKWRLAPYWEYQLSSISSLGVDIDYFDVRYDDVEDLLTDYTDARANLSFQRAFSSVTSGVITLTGRQYESDSVDSQNSISGIGLLAGFEHKFSENVELSARIGLEDTDQEGLDTDPEIVGNVTLVRSLETTQTFAQYRRTISASGASRLEVRDTVRFNFSRRLTEKISAGLGVRAYQTRAKGIPGVDSDRNFVQLNASFAWYLTADFAIQAEYRYTVLDRDVELGESTNSNRINLWFVYQPNTVPGI